jgi:hypothetical protein
MKVRFRTTVSDGQGQRYASGSVAEVEDAQAKVWLGHGLVEQVETEKRTATKAAPRKAAAKKSTRKE